MHNMGCISFQTTSYLLFYLHVGVGWPQMPDEEQHVTLIVPGGLFVTALQ
jgi:hypothetical protein